MSTTKCLKLGQRISDKGVDKYEVVKQIGCGQFSEVYQVEELTGGKKSRSQSSGDSGKSKNGSRSCALKIEKLKQDHKTSGTPLKSEIRLMRKLVDLREWVCELLDDGVCDNMLYAVFELGGENLQEVISKQSDFNIDLVIDIAAKTLKAIQQLHKAGIVHRDIKPANFVMFQGKSQDLKDATWKLVDLGVARKFTGEKGQHLAQRTSEVGFRGTVTYASISAHQQCDLSRRDDIWSWWYILVEMIQGELPWRKHKPRNSDQEANAYTLQLKQKCLKNPELLFKNKQKVPGDLVKMMNHVNRLEFEDGPDYSLLLESLETLRGTEVVKPISCSRKNSRQQLQQLMQIDEENKVSGNSSVQNGSIGNAAATGNVPLQQFGDQQQQQQIQNAQNQNQMVADGSVKRNVQSFEQKIQEHQQQSNQTRMNSQQLQYNNNNDVNGQMNSNQYMQQVGHQNFNQQYYQQQQQQQYQLQQQQNQMQNNQQALDQQFSNYKQQGNLPQTQNAMNSDQNNKYNQYQLKRNRSHEQDPQQQNKYQKMTYKPFNEEQQKGQQGNQHQHQHQPQRQHEPIQFKPHTKSSRWDVQGNQTQDGVKQFKSNQEGVKSGRQADNMPAVFETANVDSRMKRQRGDDGYHQHHFQQHQQHHHQHQHQHQVGHQQAHQRSPKAYSHHKLISSSSNVQFQNFVDAYKHNQLSVEVTKTVENLTKLRPIEAMAAIGTVIEGMTHLQPHKLHRVSKVLDSLSQYIKEAADKSREKFQKNTAQNFWA